MYNFFYALVIDSPGKPVRPAEFRLPPELGAKGHVAVETNMNPGFDEETRTLSMLNKGRGHSDCGTSSDWVRNGQGMASCE